LASGHRVRSIRPQIDYRRDFHAQGAKELFDDVFELVGGDRRSIVVGLARHRCGMAGHVGRVASDEPDEHEPEHQRRKRYDQNDHESA
jgi:hypothetical protein